MKLIVTPERKKYKFSLFIFLFITCTLFATFVYADYNRNNNEYGIVLSMNESISNNKPLNINNNKLPSINEQSVNIEATLKISKLESEYSIFSNVSDELLKKSICKLWGPEANEVGNYVIVGNNTDKMFGKLSNMTLGDTIELSDLSNKTCTYYVYDIYITKPDDVTSTSQLTDGNKEVTLITTMNNGIQRLVVKCRAI